MVTEIRLYIEGGGDSRDSKAFLRQGFSAFFTDLVNEARQKKIRWQIVMCGSRNATFEAFRTSAHQRPEAFNILLVDAEERVNGQPWTHLQQRGDWGGDGMPDHHCHLMAQVMESWFVADVAALSMFYGPNFNASAIPRTNDIEQIAKAQVASALANATRHTQKGEYHKIRHAYQILQVIKSTAVCNSAHHCERLFATVKAKMT